MHDSLFAFIYTQINTHCVFSLYTRYFNYWLHGYVRCVFVVWIRQFIHICRVHAHIRYCAAYRYTNHTHSCASCNNNRNQVNSWDEVSLQCAHWQLNSMRCATNDCNGIRCWFRCLCARRYTDRHISCMRMTYSGYEIVWLGAWMGTSMCTFICQNPFAHVECEAKM